MATAPVAATPKHLWVVGILSLLWNAFGAADYTMTETGNLAWFEMMGLGPDELAWTQSFPGWVVAAWAVGVWGSVLGSLLLLARSRHAVTAFLVSIVGAAASFAYQLTADDKPASMAGGAAVVMPVVIMILIVAQWYYARRQAAAGVLR
ncbi:MAG TPA: hypothetical protein VFS49_12745 [Croceibacterium sp.]|nr:hypothetical protein [Croceibacterium sp.]